MLKFIDRYPAAGNLTTILNEELCLGGCAHNVLVDLAKMDTALPLYAGGCIGNDANGEMVMREIRLNGIDAGNMYRIEGAGTSYTDVMIPMNGTSRTFFHYRGANALLDVEHIEKMDVPAKIFHLGYLLLLDRLDSVDNEYGIRAARALDILRKMGYKTSVDVVSEEGDRFTDIVLPCLPYIDYLIVNEVESGACYGRPLRRDNGGINLEEVENAARFLMDRGVKGACVIHFPEGGFRLDANGDSHFEPSIPLPSGEIVSPVGAGDAFCAGMLYALHEDMSPRDSLIFANTSARFNLVHASSCGGAPTISEIKGFIKQHYD